MPYKKVTMNREDIVEFARQWPGSRLWDVDGIRFEFHKGRPDDQWDLVDIEPLNPRSRRQAKLIEAAGDSDELRALSEDAQERPADADSSSRSSKRQRSIQPRIKIENAANGGYNFLMRWPGMRSYDLYGTYRRLDDALTEAQSLTDSDNAMLVKTPSASSEKERSSSPRRRSSGPRAR